MSMKVRGPFHGLPGPLPEGEHVLWQGSPQWRSLAWRAFHGREVALYFAVFALWRAGTGFAAGEGVAAAAARAAFVAPFAAVALGAIVLFAVLTARTAIYTITEKRVVMRIGVALTLTLNLPLKALHSADLRVRGDGTGDLALALAPGERLAFLNIWPHARPWRVREPQPMLRALKNPERVASVLAEALAPGGAQRVAQARAAAANQSEAPAGRHALAS